MGNFKNSVASLVNLNLGSIALAGVMIAFGSLASLLWSMFLPNSKTNSHGNHGTNTSNATSTTDSVEGTSNTDGNTATNEARRKSERAHENNKFFDLIDLLDATINPTVCVQQYVCSLRKLSAKNVADGSAASADKIIAGIFEARWILDTISGTAIHDAIQLGESRSDCDKRFSKCGVGSMRPEDLFTIFLKILRVFG
ncbi:uncharacterized protein LOC119070616 [Bradysia coprophila]|uniref:uncharacterized protein LOC119070616 n=1 Tax=Bradysia coprophila TaxID=38358 RepID=UPI00187D837D|nr:uncharacterized protein LOC119070616 [Bradysia coprophila]